LLGLFIPFVLYRDLVRVERRGLGNLDVSYAILEDQHALMVKVPPPEKGLDQIRRCGLPTSIYGVVQPSANGLYILDAKPAAYGKKGAFAPGIEPANGPDEVVNVKGRSKTDKDHLVMVGGFRRAKPNLDACPPENVHNDIDAGVCLDIKSP
jgi:hypothetical protein